jgi:hypothetical protein
VGQIRVSAARINGREKMKGNVGTIILDCKTLERDKEHRIFGSMKCKTLLCTGQLIFPHPTGPFFSSLN